MQLSKFLNKNAVLYEKQFGFKNKHFRAHVPIKIIEKVKKACDTGKFTCRVFLDLQRGFYTVNHTVF